LNFAEQDKSLLVYSAGKQNGNNDEKLPEKESKRKYYRTKQEHK